MLHKQLAGKSAWQIAGARRGGELDRFLRRPYQRTRLLHAFLELGFGIGIGDHADTGLHVHRAVLDQRGTQQDAGIRIEPVPSPPDAAATTPAATADADPPLDPPGMIEDDHGLAVGPNSDGSVVQWLPHSGVLVLPNTTRPADR